ncbi:type ISP restriction/modification enzyme [Nocardiopsis sp. FR6]|uniref:type ISP restriction/modification enzyme n=1 Tax=Nocardiopsis sp. FR6 TaxID=2605986 RepID=UPI001356BA1E|nr:type ISP restriction/modification enzyme [Nocardiopsis sp. FR6]
MTALPHDSEQNPDSTRSPLRGHGLTDRLVQAFVDDVVRLLGRGGEDEEQLRAPLKVLVERMGKALGLPNSVYGEVPLSALQARPDFGVDLTGAGQGPHGRVGYIELKRPGKPIPPERLADRRDREQWEKFRSLPNVLYTNGTEWSLLRHGTPVLRTVRTPDLVPVRKRFPKVDPAFTDLIREFLMWQPESEPGLDRLITRVAGLCAQLREEISEILAEERSRGRGDPFTRLAHEWRDLLFPHLKPDREFADVYAQTVTFSLILAREDGVDFSGRDLSGIGELLGKRHAFLGQALSLLTESREVQTVTVLPTLIRVLEAVDWPRMTRVRPRAHADLYETFLTRYDPALRKSSGSYYTPAPVADFLTGFTDSVLRERMGLPLGFADRSVTTVDPAMGSGTFLSSAMDRAHRNLEEEFGPVHTRTCLKDLYRDRLIGFERSTAAFAVSELRLHQQLREQYGAEVPEEHRRFLCNTLDDPNHHYQSFGRRYDDLVYFREQANRVKSSTPVMVVIGNPPYVESAKQRDPAPWLERRRAPAGDPVTARPSMDEFREPGRGGLDYKLSAVSLYFWRWATWKAFDAHPEQPSGVVAFVSTSAYLTGEAFAGMRRYLRSTADEGWIVDLSPEGHRPPVSTRVFGGVQQPVCIGVFARYGPARPDVPARIWHTDVEGLRAEKFAALEHDEGLRLDGGNWRECLRGWTDPFHPQQDRWGLLPAVGDLMPWHSPGVKTNRTWVITPDRATFNRRWERLSSARPVEQDRLFKATADRSTTRRLRAMPRITDDREPPRTTLYAHRAFDLQHVTEDVRYVDRPRPGLWAANGDRQIHVVEQHSKTIASGPGLLFSALIPDMDYFNGRGGRVLPLYRDPSGRSPNLAPGLLAHLTERLGRGVGPEDVVAYLAAVAAHPGYTAAFREELRTPGIRIPLTADPELWDRAVKIGREVVWLHTYGVRMRDPAARRPAHMPRLPRPRRPQVIEEIPDRPGHLPDRIWHDGGQGPGGPCLHVGEGVIAPVETAAWEYEVGGMHVIRKWFAARERDPRHVRRGSPLDDIRPNRWTPEFTEQLLHLITVLTRLVDLEPSQRDLLARIRTGPLITVEELGGARVLPVPSGVRKGPRGDGQGEIPLA